MTLVNVLAFLFLLAALVCFLIAAFRTGPSKVDLGWVGCALFTCAALIGRLATA